MEMNRYSLLAKCASTLGSLLKYYFTYQLGRNDVYDHLLIVQNSAGVIVAF
jgi:membrane protein YqaA with SNARE-associated domain